MIQNNIINSKMKEKQLVKISTYAKSIDKSVQWVYKLIESNEVKCVIIDGVKFIEV